MSDILFPRVAVIGIGLIGASFTLALREAGALGTAVCGDADKMNIGKAIELEIVDGGSRSNADAVRDADLVILSTPVGALEKVALEIAPHLKKGCIVSDVGSVKGAAVKAIAPHLPEGVFYVGGHPIAGTEDSGPEAAFAEMFRGKWCMLTPTTETDPAALAKMKKAWELCGASVVCLEPSHHDKILATVSHLPHVIAFSIMGTADDLAHELGGDVSGYAGSSFRDLTRVAASDPVMWRDIFLNNREAVLELIARFKGDMARLEKAIADGDAAEMEKIFTRGRALRRALGSPRAVEPLEIKA